MADTQFIDNVDQQFQELLAAFLRTRRGISGAGDHLDEDTLSAFAAGGLSDREMRPVVAHLADCKLCRSKTSDLIRLDFATTESVPEERNLAAEQREAAGSAISAWFRSLFGIGEAGVFAHGEPAEDVEEESETSTGESPASEEKNLNK